MLLWSAVYTLHANDYRQRELGNYLSFKPVFDKNSKYQLSW